MLEWKYGSVSDCQQEKWVRRETFLIETSYHRPLTANCCSLRVRASCVSCAVSESDIRQTKSTHLRVDNMTACALCTCRQ